MAKEILVVSNCANSNESKISFVDSVGGLKSNFFEYWIKGPVFSQKRFNWFDLSVCMLMSKYCYANNKSVIEVRVDEYCKAVSDQSELEIVDHLSDDIARGAYVLLSYVRLVRHAYCLSEEGTDSYFRNIESLNGVDSFVKELLMMVDDSELMRSIEVFELTSGVFFKELL